MARILIVEDSPLLSDALIELLTKYTDFTFDLATTYEETQQLLKSKRYEYSIVDLHLPDANDGQVVGLVNKYKLAPIIFTSDFDEDMREGFESANVVDYVLKDDLGNVRLVIEKLRQLELNKERTILLVDDSKTYQTYLKSNLKIHNFNVVLADNGEDALEILSLNKNIELVITDYHMPKMDGLELVFEIRKLYSRKELSVIVLTAGRDPFTTSRFLKVGANDYIAKPFSRDEFYSRIYHNIETLDIFDTIRTKFDNDIIELLSEITEFKSAETSSHVRRIQEYTYTLARIYGVKNSEALAMGKMSILHDIGKVTISDTVLCKPAKLTPEEFNYMKTHAENGYILVKKAFASDPKMGRLAMDIARFHHEKYDGSGYPQGLQGNKIPLSARIVSLVDVFDALANKRVYKDAWSMEDITSYLHEQKGISFDPKLVTLFLENIECFTDILIQSEKNHKDSPSICKILSKKV